MKRAFDSYEIVKKYIDLDAYPSPSRLGVSWKITDAGIEYNTDDEIEHHVRIIAWYPKVNKVIFNDPATIVFFSDGDKVVVKTMPGDIFDPEKGLAMAISKKFLGKSYHRIFKENVKRYEETKRLTRLWLERCANDIAAVGEAFKNMFSKGED